MGFSASEQRSKTFRIFATSSMPVRAASSTSSSFVPASNSHPRLLADKEAVLKDDTSIVAVTDLLKLYLRNLAEPLIPFSTYKSLITLACGKLVAAAWGGLRSLTFAPLLPDKKGIDVAKVKQLIEKMPVEHQNLLQYLLEFLVLVMSHSAKNKVLLLLLALAIPCRTLVDRSWDEQMTAENLAIVIAPNILRFEYEDANVALKDAKHVNKAVEFMIKNCSALFPVRFSLLLLLLPLRPQALTLWVPPPQSPLKLELKPADDEKVATAKQAQEAEAKDG